MTFYLLKKKSFSSSKEALRTFLVLMISSFATNVYFLSPFNSLPLSSIENVLLTKGCDFMRVSWFSKVIPSAKLIYICFKEVGGISKYADRISKCLLVFSCSNLLVSVIALFLRHCTSRWHKCTWK